MKCSPRAVALLALVVACPAQAARVGTGELLTTAQPPFSAVLVVGVLGEGSLTVDGGTLAEEDALALGALEGASGTLLVSGAGSKFTAVGDPVTRASAITVGFM